jgi:hypothetical protein
MVSAVTIGSKSHLVTWTTQQKHKHEVKLSLYQLIQVH